MKKLAFCALLLTLATACPKVERRVYTFDLTSNTGTLVFENIVTDEPDKADEDFMQVVNKVIRGSDLETEHPGWRIGDKELFENEGRLDGVARFRFDNAAKAGLYKHDKKSPYIWCASRTEDHTIVSTNGTRIDDVLPGCVAWNRKMTELTVTVKSASLDGTELPLLSSFRRWSTGEELGADAGTGLGTLLQAAGGEEALELGKALATGLMQGLADEVSQGADLTLGPPKGDKDLAALAFEGTEALLVKMCAAASAGTGAVFRETLVLTVQPDGSFAVTVEGSNDADPDRHACYADAFQNASFAKAKATRTVRYPVAASKAEPR